MSSTFKHTVKASPNEVASLAVTYSGHQKCEAHHRWGKGIREQFILHLIASGKGTYITPRGDFQLSAGDIFLIRPNTEIEYFADPDDPWEYYWVNFSGTDSQLILSRTDFSDDKPFMNGCDDEVFSLFEQILANPGKEDFENIRLTATLYTLLSELVRRSQRQVYSQREDYRRKCLKSAVDYIAANYPLPISVEDIAASADISRTTLFRIFKSELNTTPVDYLIDCRISRAKKLLGSTDLSVTAVARSTGYEDNMYFSRAFKKITGITPSQYRENVQQKSI